MKINEARNNIQLAINLLNELKENNDNSSIKIEIEKLLDAFTPTTITNLKKKLEKVKKRRIRDAARRKKIKLFKEEVADRRRRQAADVDRMFIQHQENVARAKTEESVRRQADVVLQAVTRRKADARRMLALLPSLVKLRAGLCQQAAAQGATPSQAVTDAFETAIGYVRGLWEKQLEGYNVEESGLKIMLDEGCASKLGRAERDLDTNLHEWHVAMFGQGSRPELNFQQLVEIRSQWDQFVVAPDTVLSSGMPEGWLMPQPLLDEKWKNGVIFD